MTKPNPTLGQRRTQPTGRPDGDLVNRVRLAFAGLIDLVAGIPTDGSADISRPKAIALTEIESASHWAVKAAARAENPGESASNPDSGDPRSPQDQN